MAQMLGPGELSGTPDEPSVVASVPPPTYGRAYEADPLRGPSERTPLPPLRHAPRVLFSIAHAFGYGRHANTDAVGLLGVELALGVQWNPLVSVQLQAAYTWAVAGLARGALIVGLSPAPQVSVGLGVSVTGVHQWTGAYGIAVGVPLDVTFCFGADPPRGERRYGFLLGIRLDPGIGVVSETGTSFGGGAIGVSGLVTMGFITR